MTRSVLGRGAFVTPTNAGTPTATPIPRTVVDARARAQRDAAETADVARAQGRRDLEVMALTTVARASLELGDVERALASSERALA